ncbi:MAG: type II and III secretion system protein family protein [Acidobacteria bacterium]|nr:type II and III secretion system protein family protein [Acidobacteriota bacterium]
MRRIGYVGLILLIMIAGDPFLLAAEGDSVNLTVGRSLVLNTGSPIARVSLTSADVADAMVTSPNEVLINGKMPGTISMFVWDRAGAIRRYDVVVQRDIAGLCAQLKELFPGEKIDAQSNGKSIVLSGLVSGREVVERAISVAAGYVDKRDDVVTLLRIQDAGMSNQVMLRVRFAEVSRNALTQLGASWISDGYRNTVGSITTGQFPAPFFDQNKATIGDRQVFSDYLNLFLFDFGHDLGAVVKALRSQGLFQSLAEPNLVAESGKEASFLAGGEFPIPVAQASGANVAISVQFKEFGVRLTFTPTVVGDRVHLKVRPEVSTLDFNNAILLQGFRIPALSTRRAETELELRNGQTFAMAGLINNTVASTMQKIPGIGDIPILGKLFQSKAAQKDQTELVVMIEPQILPRNSPGVTPNLPQQAEPYLVPALPRPPVPPPPPAFTAPVKGPEPVPAPTPAPAPKGSGTPVRSTTGSTPSAAEAAAIISALHPKPKIVVTPDPPPAPVKKP